MNYKIKTLGIDYTRGGRRYPVQPPPHPEQDDQYAQAGN